MSGAGFWDPYATNDGSNWSDTQSCAISTGLVYAGSVERGLVEATIGRDSFLPVVLASLAVRVLAQVIIVGGLSNCCARSCRELNSFRFKYTREPIVAVITVENGMADAVTYSIFREALCASMMRTVVLVTAVRTKYRRLSRYKR